MIRVIGNRPNTLNGSPAATTPVMAGESMIAAMAMEITVLAPSFCEAL